jgi:hypothetical protein
MKWFRAVGIGEEVEILLERAAVLGSTYFAYLVYLEGGHSSGG